MTRRAIQLGLLLVLGAVLFACAALEGLGSPPDIVAPDGSALPDAAPLTDGPETTDSGLADGAPVDSSFSSPSDSGPDTSPDASADGSPDAPADASPDAPADAASDAASDASTDAASGTLDPTFGMGGIATFSVPGASSTSLGAQGLTVQADGRIAFAGVINTPEVATLLVGRVNPDGGVDTSFATNGFFTTNSSEFYDEVGSAIRALPANGGLVCAGFAFPAEGGGGVHQMFAAKFLDDGGLDPSFASGAGQEGIPGGNTMVGLPVTYLDTEADSLLIQPDGKLVLGGYVNTAAALLRLNADGSQDESFDPGFGAAIFGPNVYPTAGSQVRALGLLPGGDLLAGTSLTTGATLTGARFVTDGGLDPTYGYAGIASVPAAAVHGANGVIVQGESAVFVGSSTSAVEAERFVADGGLDPTFGEAGFASTPIPTSSTVTAYAAASMTDGRFVVATGLSSSTPIGVARFTADGALDTTFAGVGYAGIAGAAGSTEAVAIDAVGRIYIGASYGGVVTIARFLP